MKEGMPEPGVAGVIGWPIKHSKSPLIHRFWLAKLGIDGDYSRFPVAPERLGDFIRALPAMGLRGVNVTIPHKVAVMDYLDAVDGQAQAIGAVNTVWLWPNGQIIGSNTDVEGIRGPAWNAIEGRHMLIVGSGGAARAAVAAANEAGAARISIMARNHDRAGALLDIAQSPAQLLAWDAPLPDDVGLLFNATSLGMAGQPPLSLDLSPLQHDAVVFDAVYAPLETGLLKAARARGLDTIDGLQMLVGQAALAFMMFFGVNAPRQHDDELRALLTR